MTLLLLYVQFGLYRRSCHSTASFPCTADCTDCFDHYSQVNSWASEPFPTPLSWPSGVKLELINMLTGSIITIHITYAQLNKAAAILLVPSSLKARTRGFLQPQLPQHHLVCPGQSLRVSQAKPSIHHLWYRPVTALLSVSINPIPNSYWSYCLSWCVTSLCGSPPLPSQTSLSCISHFPAWNICSLFHILQ